ncbi:MAG: NAD-dependent epimerase/dehydratase family protein [Nitrospirae bacterium]|nr:NAD-dependent epimerase/dehydratase family protein [Nitrospirota bacterium]
MTVMVTGGTGFVGGAIVRALVARGERVRVLARRTSKIEPLTSLGVEIAYGDILDRASVEAALQGCDTLYHAAALYDFWVPDKQAMMQTEIEGTRCVLEATLQYKVDRVIYTSTAIVIGEHKGEVGTESTKRRDYFLTTAERAKFEAEQVAILYLQKGLPIIIVSPAGAYGPSDLKPTGRSIINVLNGRVPYLFKGAISVVYVDDVGAGHVLAKDRGRIGERYILSERIVTMEEWFGLACQLAGTKRPPFGPVFPIRLLADLGDFASRWTHRPPLMSRDTVELVVHGLRVDGSKAVKELGMRYTPFDEGMRKAIGWYWQQGLLQHKPACVA